MPISFTLFLYIFIVFINVFDPIGGKLKNDGSPEKKHIKLSHVNYPSEKKYCIIIE